MRVAIIGANGQLGTDLVKAFFGANHSVWSRDHRDLDVSNRDSVKAALDMNPEVIVNTACLHTAACATDPAKAYLINAIGAKNVAEVAKECGALVQHISTDQVFDGRSDRPYGEGDNTNPLTVYGDTKRSGEGYVLNSGARFQILRTTALFGHQPTRGKPGQLNFVDLMLKLAKERHFVSVVNDEFTCPTSTATLARQAVLLAERYSPGIFHTVSTGGCSWYEFAEEIFKQTGTEVDLQVAPPATGIKPKRLVLRNTRLIYLGWNIFKDWREELREYLDGK